MAEERNEAEKEKGEVEGREAERRTSITVVLGVDMHCEGCIMRIVRTVRHFKGVETVKAEAANNRLTITGVVDPSKLREQLQRKTKKEVALICPQQKKEENSYNYSSSTDPKQQNNEKKPKETMVTMAVLKMRLHCQGCIEKIRKTIAKTKGMQEISIDQEKELVTIKGTMNVNSLTKRLKRKLKRPVEIVPPKIEYRREAAKTKDGYGSGGGRENEAEGRIMGHWVQPGFACGFDYARMPCSCGHPEAFPLTQLFSDENPMACSIM